MSRALAAVHSGSAGAFTTTSSFAGVGSGSSKRRPPSSSPSVIRASLSCTYAKPAIMRLAPRPRPISILGQRTGVLCLGEMRDKTPIEWTEATWNPVTGCDKVSPGCAHCYAEAFAERFRGVHGHPYEQGFDLKLWPTRLDMPRKWRTPRLIFVNSMSDLFHEDIPFDYVRQVFSVMEECHWHRFQVLTKRHARLAT